MVLQPLLLRALSVLLSISPPGSAGDIAYAHISLPDGLIALSFILLRKAEQ